MTSKIKNPICHQISILKMSIILFISYKLYCTGLIYKYILGMSVTTRNFHIGDWPALFWASLTAKRLIERVRNFYLFLSICCLKIWQKKLIFFLVGYPQFCPSKMGPTKKWPSWLPLPPLSWVSMKGIFLCLKYPCIVFHSIYIALLSGHDNLKFLVLNV